jgi:2,3-dihydroxybenzoate-AMP ligase
MPIDGFVPWPDELARRYRRHGLWEGLTIGEVVERTAQRLPEKVAVVCGEQRLSYRELVERSRRLALGLHRAGLGRGDRAVLQLPNSVDFVLAYLALQWLGAVPVMALRPHRQAELRHFIAASGATAYLVPDVAGGFDFREMAAQMQREFPTLRWVAVAGAPGPGQRALAAMVDDALPMAEVEAALAPLAPAPDELCTMLLSGGTTSLNKLIPRTHDDYVLNARACGAVAGMGEDTVFMAILPLGHNYNLASPGMLGTFYHGGTLVLTQGSGTEEVFATVESERVTLIAAVVPLITAWLNSDVPGRHDLASLRVVQNGGARLAPELRRRLREQLHCTPQEVYGTAEGLINMTRLDDPADRLLESSGAPVLDEDEIRVVDDDGRDLPDGEPGELVTRGPYTIRGYFDAPQKNAEAFLPGGWYRMGDIVRKQGRHVYTEGRRKDLINRGGEKISCDEVENLIFAHPAVKAVALVAMPDPVFGEKACAFVVPKPGFTLELPELVAFLRGRQIASFKLPERLELVDSLPLSPVGKILKRELREQLIAKMQDESPR